MAGCTSISPTTGIAAGPNTFPRGTAAFCERYAEQTYDSTFQIQKIASSDAWAGQQAKVSAQNAYRRCLQGKTN
ncbi:hypothetical protein [Aureimonas psammosilenae]|uniref:hypothetical protein n=1 Tax=Aureimonas psammosilenae TaxID=2495496 RepID=UPI0012605325|nr:hypothetical protein [Aureimonas psammosilenae]